MLGVAGGNDCRRGRRLAGQFSGRGGRRDAAQREDASPSAHRRWPRNSGVGSGDDEAPRRHGPAFARFDPSAALLFDARERASHRSAGGVRAMSERRPLDQKRRQDLPRRGKPPVHAVKNLDMEVEPRRDRRVARLVRLRQDLDLAHDRGLRRGDPRGHRLRGPADRSDCRRRVEMSRWLSKAIRSIRL